MSKDGMYYKVSQEYSELKNFNWHQHFVDGDNL